MSREKEYAETDQRDTKSRFLRAFLQLGPERPAKMLQNLEGSPSTLRRGEEGQHSERRKEKEGTRLEEVAVARVPRIGLRLDEVGDGAETGRGVVVRAGGRDLELVVLREERGGD